MILMIDNYDSFTYNKNKKAQETCALANSPAASVTLDLWYFSLASMPRRGTMSKAFT